MVCVGYAEMQATRECVCAPNVMVIWLVANMVVRMAVSVCRKTAANMRTKANNLELATIEKTEQHTFAAPLPCTNADGVSFAQQIETSID